MFVPMPLISQVCGFAEENENVYGFPPMKESVSSIEVRDHKSF
jgi:hypothetical protein